VSSALVTGLPTAVVAAALYGVGPVVQALAARRESAGEGLGLRLLARLTLRPLWLLGLTVEASSFLLEVYALSVAPVALVAPVMALDMIVFTLLARRVLGERISRTGWVGVASMVAGIGLLAYAFERDAEVGAAASTSELLAFLVLGMLFALIAGFVANVSTVRARVAAAALGFGLAAGVSYAIATLATRQIGLWVNEHRSDGPRPNDLVDLLSTPTPYVLVLFSVLALSLEQRGLQGRAAIIAFPVTSGVSAFLPVTLGLTLFDEPSPGGARLVAFVVSLGFVAAGIVGLGRDRMAAGHNAKGDAESPRTVRAGPASAGVLPDLPDLSDPGVAQPDAASGTNHRDRS
jgi:drug/metabolite transporter (DMT)-like permease